MNAHLPKRLSGISPDLIVFGVLAGAAMALFAPLLFGGRLFSGWFVNLYHVYFFAAQKYLIFDLRQWPTWWPQFFSGYPISLTLDGFLNPIFIITLKFAPVIPAYAWLTFLFFTANLFAMFALARNLGLNRTASIIAAVSYGFSGIIIRWTEVIVFASLFPILPLSFLAVRKIQEGSRRWWWAWTALLTYSWIGGFSELMAYFLIAVGGYSIALLFTSGTYPRALWRTKPFLTLLAFLKEGTRKFFLPIVVSLALVSPWLISVLYFIVTYSNRSGGLSVDQASSMPVAISHLIRLFLPRLSVPYGDNIPYLRLADDIDLFIGTVPLLLLLTLPFSWRSVRRKGRWFFVGLLAFAILMSFRSPLYLLLHQLPVLRWFRWHFKWSFLTVFAAALLAGYAMEDLGAFFRHRRANIALGVAASVFGIATAAIAATTIFAAPLKTRLAAFAMAHVAGETGQTLHRSLDYYARNVALMVGSLVNGFSFRNALTLLTVSLWGIALAAFAAGFSKRIDPKKQKIFFVTAAILGSVLVWTGFLDGRPASYLTEEPATAAFLHAQNAYRDVPVTGQRIQREIPYRIFTFFPEQTLAAIQDESKVNLMDSYTHALLTRELLDDNINTWFHFDGMFNHEPLGVARTASFYDLLNGPRLTPNATVDTLTQSVARFSSDRNARMAGMMNIKYVLSTFELGGPWKLVFTSRILDGKVPVRIYENPFFLPRWYFASNIRWTDAAGSDASSTELSKTADVRDTTLLDARTDADRALASATDTNDGLTLDVYTAGRLSLATRTKHARWLVFSETGAPFWRARIDGRAAPLLRANIAYQAVLVPPGEHHVEFTVLDFWQQARASLASLIGRP